MEAIKRERDLLKEQYDDLLHQLEERKSHSREIDSLKREVEHWKKLGACRIARMAASSSLCLTERRSGGGEESEIPTLERKKSEQDCLNESFPHQQFQPVFDVIEFPSENNSQVHITGVSLIGSWNSFGQQIDLQPTEDNTLFTIPLHKLPLSPPSDQPYQFKFRVRSYTIMNNTSKRKHQST